MRPTESVVAFALQEKVVLATAVLHLDEELMIAFQKSPIIAAGRPAVPLLMQVARPSLLQELVTGTGIPPVVFLYSKHVRSLHDGMVDPARDVEGLEVLLLPRSRLFQN